MSHLLARFSPSLILILLVGATHLPFLSQAFHIDDRIYLEVAENALEKPFFPYDYLPVFEGVGASDAASHSHLPLTSYYLALVMAVTGSQSEWVYHLSFLIFPILAGLGFYDLARRYTRFPLAAACLLLLAPAFLVLSHTLMSDVPFWTFWILTLSRFLRIRDGSANRWDWIVCALSLVAASFVSLLTVGLILLMGAHLLLDRRSSQISWHWALILALPLLVWFAWYLRAYLHYDRFVLASTALHMAKRAAFLLGRPGPKDPELCPEPGGDLSLSPGTMVGVRRTDQSSCLHLGLSLVLRSLLPLVGQLELDSHLSFFCSVRLWAIRGLGIHTGDRPSYFSGKQDLLDPLEPLVLGGVRNLPGPLLLRVGALRRSGSASNPPSLDCPPGAAFSEPLPCQESAVAGHRPYSHLFLDSRSRRLSVCQRLSSDVPGDRQSVRPGRANHLVHRGVGISLLHGRQRSQNPAPNW